jgi:hypothetical protein
MSVRFARTLAFVFLAAYAVAVTWPGIVPFNRVYPLVLGLPFNMVWIALWICAGCAVLWMVDHAESARRRNIRHADRDGDRPPSASPDTER